MNDKTDSEGMPDIIYVDEVDIVEQGLDIVNQGLSKEALEQDKFITEYVKRSHVQTLIDEACRKQREACNQELLDSIDAADAVNDYWLKGLSEAILNAKGEE